MKVIPEPAGSGRRRSRRIYLLAGGLVIAAMAFAVVSLAGQVGTNSGFEDDDANLAAASTTDWNSFAPLTWTGTAPKRVTTSTANGWAMSGFEDYIATTSDDGFAGGVKQDDDCASVKAGKAPNKDDLKRVYLATKTVNVNAVPHVFLSFSFVRIPLNSTQSSTHIGFEFNEQRLGACASGPLFKRTPQAWGTTDNTPAHSGGDPSNPGDLLIVYDYEGSTTSPTLSLRHWIDSGSTIGQSCEISQDSPPCWSTATTLPAGVAEAQVNFGANSVPGAGITDSLAPTSASNGASHNETLGLKEFGEAGVDLTAAGVFTPGVCTAFGQSEAVSRSSGNSGTASMEDLVAGPFTLNNCGEIKIIKQSKPRGLDQKFSFSSGTVAGTLKLSQNANAGGVAQPDCSTPGQTPTAGVDATGKFCLNDKDNSGKAAPPAFGASDNNGTGTSTANSVDETNLQPGTYTVTEGSNPNGFAFDSVTCKVNGTTTTLNTVAAPKTVTIALNANDVVVCIYQNNQQLGAINVTKTAKNANCGDNSPPTGCSSGKAPLGSVGIEIWQESNSTTGLQTTGNSPDTRVKTEQLTASSGTGLGTTCFSDLAFNNADATHPYYVHESTIPTGYTPGTSQQDQTVTISANSTCAGSPVQVGVENVPLSRIEVKFTSLAGTGVTRAQVVCKDSSNATVLANSENGSNDNSSGQSGTDPTFDDSDELFGNGTSGLKPGVYNCEVNVDP